jgi:membrane-associated phospholipid phosphatase
MTDRKSLFRGVVAVLALIGAGVCCADDLTAGTVARDVRDYFTAPLRWRSDEWTTVGASLIAIGVAHQYDDEVRSHFLTGRHAAARGDDPRNLEDALPAAVVLVSTFAVSAIAGSDAGYDEAWAMTEASALSGVATLTLKYVFGRERPNDTDDASAWFAGGDAFPSMHTTLAFAIGTVLAESGNDRDRWLRRTVGYGMAAGTAYLRVRDNVHWLSDTVAGAALGIASAEFAMHRRDSRRRSDMAMSMSPLEDGVMISCAWPIH